MLLRYLGDHPLVDDLAAAWLGYKGAGNAPSGNGSAPSQSHPDALIADSKEKQIKAMQQLAAMTGGRLIIRPKKDK